MLRELAAPQIWGLALVFGGPQLALAGWSLAQWGHLGGPLMIDRAPFSLDAFRVGIFGLLVDRENGLFVWAPLYLTLPAAWWMTRSFSLVLLVPSILLIVPSAAHDQWWGGFSPAARFLVPLVPIFALVIAHAVKNRTFAMTWYALLLPQFILSAYCWQNARQLWPQGTGENPVVMALPLIGSAISRLLPSLRSLNPDLGVATVWIAAIAVANVLLLVVVYRRVAG